MQRSLQIGPDKTNLALPDSPAWQELLENWNTISSQSTARHLALPPNLPPIIRSYVSRAHLVGKSSLGTNTIINLDELYPFAPTQAQSLIIEEAVSLGQGIALEMTQITKSSSIKAINDEEKNHSASDVPAKAMHLSEPDRFDGTRSLFGHYITRLQLHFRSFPRSFDSDDDKIRFAASYLSGNAYTWFQPHVNQETGDIAFSKFEDFINALRAAFDDPDTYATAEREILFLRQDGSCAAYYAKMISLFSQLGWYEEKVRIHHFRQGLKDSLKDALVGKQTPKSFPEFAAFCIALDNEIYARLREKRQNLSQPVRPKPFTSPQTITQPYSAKVTTPSVITPPNVSPAPNYDPMELDNSEAGKAARKAYRWANNLCGYCGKSGHKIATCPTLANRSSPSLPSPPKSQLTNTELESPAATLNLYEPKNLLC